MFKSHNPRSQPVVVEPEALDAGLSLYDLGLYVKVSEWLPLLVEDVSFDDLIMQVRYGVSGEQNSDAELRAGLQRLADAGLLAFDDQTDETGPTSASPPSGSLPPPYSPPAPQQHP